MLRRVLDFPELISRLLCYKCRLDCVKTHEYEMKPGIGVLFKRVTLPQAHPCFLMSLIAMLSNAHLLQRNNNIINWYIVKLFV